MLLHRRPESLSLGLIHANFPHPGHNDQKAAIIGNTTKASLFTRSVCIASLPESAPAFGVPSVSGDDDDGLVVPIAAVGDVVGTVNDLADDGLSMEDSATADEEGSSSLEGSSSSVEDLVADGSSLPDTPSLEMLSSSVGLTATALLGQFCISGAVVRS